MLAELHDPRIFGRIIGLRKIFVLSLPVGLPLSSLRFPLLPAQNAREEAIPKQSWNQWG